MLRAKLLGAVAAASFIACGSNPLPSPHQSSLSVKGDSRALEESAKRKILASLKGYLGALAGEGPMIESVLKSGDSVFIVFVAVDQGKVQPGFGWVSAADDFRSTENIQFIPGENILMKTSKKERALLSPLSDGSSSVVAGFVNSGVERVDVVDSEGNAQDSVVPGPNGGVIVLVNPDSQEIHIWIGGEMIRSVPVHPES